MGYALKLDSHYENQRDWSFFEEKHRTEYTYDANSERLTEDYKFTYLYDNNGNLIVKNPKNQAEKAYRYEYTSTNQLKSVITLSNPFGSVVHQVNFDYDVLGRRMRKEIIDQIMPGNNSFTLYQYDGDDVVLESKNLTQTSSYGVVAVYTHSLATDDVLAVNIPSLGITNKKAKQSGNYYFLKDHLGSIAAITDNNGNIKQQYKYSSYGKILQIEDGAGTDIASDRFIDNQYTYTGREFDSEINTYYYRARYYDASIGRFLQQDPHPGYIANPSSVVNSYIYTNNKPTMLRDPSGRFPILVAAFLVGALVGGTIAAMQPGATFGSVLGAALTGGVMAAVGTGAMAAGAWAATAAASGLGFSVGVGTSGAFLAGGIGGALGSVAFASLMGASGPYLLLAAVTGFVGGGTMAYSGVFGSSFNGNAVENTTEAVDSLNNSLKPDGIPSDNIFQQNIGDPVMRYFDHGGPTLMPITPQPSPLLIPVTPDPIGIPLFYH